MSASGARSAGPLNGAFLNVEPVFPDFYTCGARYGHDINPADCAEALYRHFPRGSHNIPLYIAPYVAGTPLRPQENLQLPFTGSSGAIAPYNNTTKSKSFVGTCSITISAAGRPLEQDGDHINAIPDIISGMAAHVIDKCPAQTAEQFGGFQTSNLHHPLDALTEVPANLENDDVSVAAPMRYLTVTVWNPTNKRKEDPTPPEPGDMDATVPEHLDYAIREKRDDADADRRKRFLGNMAKRMYDVSTSMIGSDSNPPPTWWRRLAASRVRAGAPHPHRRGVGGMRYDCDAKLGQPKASDCEQLLYSQLGTGDGDIVVGDTNPYIRVSGTCAISIQAARTMTVQLKRIRAATEALSNYCVDGPFAHVGGRAMRGRQSFGSWWRTISGGRRRDLSERRQLRNEDEDEEDEDEVHQRAKSATEITGANALPPGVEIELWQHDGACSAAAELGFVQRMGDVSQCKGR